MTGRESTLVDGGLLSNYPIDSLDRPDGKRPRWPTFGVTLLPNLPEHNDKVIPALAPLRLVGGPSVLEDVITTILVGRDQAYLNLPWVSARTIRVDATNRGLRLERVDLAAAATRFLSTWDERAYLDRFR